MGFWICRFRIWYPFFFNMRSVWGTFTVILSTFTKIVNFIGENEYKWKNVKTAQQLCELVNNQQQTDFQIDPPVVSYHEFQFYTGYFSFYHKWCITSHISHKIVHHILSIKRAMNPESAYQKPSVGRFSKPTKIIDKKSIFEKITFVFGWNDIFSVH